MQVRKQGRRSETKGTRYVHEVCPSKAEITLTSIAVLTLRHGGQSPCAMDIEGRLSPLLQNRNSSTLLLLPRCVTQATANQMNC